MSLHTHQTSLHTSLARDVTTAGTATLLSRLLGFVRDAGIAAVLGAGSMSDAFFAALLLPNLFRRLLAEGALNAAFVPAWLRITTRQGQASKQAWRFGLHAALILLAALGGVALLCAVFAQHTVAIVAPGFDDPERAQGAARFLRLSIAYIAIAGPIAVGAAILNAERRVAAAAFAVVIYNATTIVAVAAVVASGAAATPRAGDVLALSIVAAGMLQMLLIAVALWRLARGSAARDEATRDNESAPGAPEDSVGRFFMRAVPGVIAAGIPQLKLMAGIMIASASPSATSWLYYAYRLYELPLGVASVAISFVMVPLIAASLRADNEQDARVAQSQTLEIGLGLALPAATALAILATPITAALFERGAFGAEDTQAVAAALAAIAAGLPGHVTEKVFGAICFAHGDTRTPMFAALAGLATAVVAGLLLFPIHGHVGVALAIALSGWVGATLLCVILLWRGWLGLAQGGPMRLVRIVCATAAMAAALAAGLALFSRAPTFAHTTAGRLLIVAVLVAGGLGVYTLALQSLGIMRIDALRDALLRRDPRG